MSINFMNISYQDHRNMVIRFLASQVTGAKEILPPTRMTPSSFMISLTLSRLEALIGFPSFKLFISPG